MRRRNSHSFNSERARAAARRRWQPPPPSLLADDAAPHPAQRERAGAPLDEAPGHPQKLGTSGVPWTIEAARQAALNPRTPAYVAQRAREWLHEQEQKLVARQEPDPTLAMRGVNLIDLVSLAVACGAVDLDVLVAAAKAARAPTVESS
jgi:hypothetical protein